MAEEPERLRTLPRRLGVRRKALVEDTERDGEVRAAKVGVELRELVGGAERLVDDRAERERGHIEVVARVESLARAERRELGVASGGRLEQRLLDQWGRRAGGRAERVRVDRHLAPRAYRDALRAARVLDGVPCAAEHHREPEPGLGQQRRRKRQQQPRTVPRACVGGDGATMAHTPKRLEHAVEHLPRRRTVEPRHEPDATGIAFERDRFERRRSRQGAPFVRGRPARDLGLAGEGGNEDAG